MGWNSYLLKQRWMLYTAFVVVFTGLCLQSHQCLILCWEMKPVLLNIINRLKGWGKKRMKNQLSEICYCINSWASWASRERKITYVMTVIPIKVHFLYPNRREITCIVAEYLPTHYLKWMMFGNPPERMGLTWLFNRRNPSFRHWYLDQWRMFYFIFFVED